MHALRDLAHSITFESLVICSGFVLNVLDIGFELGFFGVHLIHLLIERALDSEQSLELVAGFTLCAGQGIVLGPQKLVHLFDLLTDLRHEQLPFSKLVRIQLERVLQEIARVSHRLFHCVFFTTINLDLRFECFQITIGAILGLPL